MKVVVDKHFPDVVAHSISEYAFLCFSCKSSCDTKSCSYCFFRSVCHDCAVACVHCDKRVICKYCHACFFYNESCRGCGNTIRQCESLSHECVHNADFMCSECENKHYLPQTEKYVAFCKACTPTEEREVRPEYEEQMRQEKKARIRIQEEEMREKMTSKEAKWVKDIWSPSSKPRFWVHTLKRKDQSQIRFGPFKRRKVALQKFKSLAGENQVESIRCKFWPKSWDKILVQKDEAVIMEFISAYS